MTENHMSEQEVQDLWKMLRGILDTVEEPIGAPDIVRHPVSAMKYMHGYVGRSERALNALERIVDHEFPDWAKQWGGGQQ